MIIKSKIISNPKQEHKYPCLMKNVQRIYDEEIIILAKGGNKEILKGYVLNKNTHYNVGYWKSDWDAKEFIVFNGTITLNNQN